MFATGETVGLVKWIIDDTCLVIITFLHEQTTLRRGLLGHFKIAIDLFLT